MGPEKYYTQQKEYSFSDFLSFLIKNQCLEKLLEISSNLIKLSKNVADFIKKGLLENSEIINTVQQETLKGVDSYYFECCTNLMKYQEQDSLKAQIIQ
jgi:hypothetical protein